MPGGTWNPSAPPVRMGAYFNFLAALQQAVSPGQSGRCVIVGTGSWGPVGTVVEVGSQALFDQTFGAGTGTLRDGVLAAFGGFDEVGGATTVLCYRAALPSAAAATATVNAGDSSPGITLTAKYKGTRGNNFSYVIQTNTVDSSKKDLLLFESGVLLESLEGIVNTNTAFAAAVTAGSQYLAAATQGAGARAMQNVTSTPLAGGSDGSAITITEVSAALALLKGLNFNTIALSGINDTAMQKAFVTWADAEVNARGLRSFAFIGGANDETYAAAKLRSIGSGSDVNANSINVVNVGASDLIRLVDGVQINGSQLACRLAGAQASIGFRRSLTNVRLTGYQVKAPLTDSQYVDAINNGVLTLSNDTPTRVQIELGVTSLATPDLGSKPKASQKIRNVAVQHFIETTLTRVAKDGYIGSMPNSSVAQNDLIVSFQKFLEALEDQGALQRGTSVAELDTNYVSTGNAVFVKFSIVHLDTVERIFTTVRVR
jgi:hypothetical protein